VRRPNLDHDDLPDRVLRASFPVEGEQLGIEGTGFQNRRDAFEPVSPANEGIDDVHFHVGVVPQVRECARRSDIREHEMVVVPDRCRSFGREIRCSVGTDRGDEAEALLLDNPLHVSGEYGHGPVSWSSANLDLHDVPIRVSQAYQMMRIALRHE